MRTLPWVLSGVLAVAACGNKAAKLEQIRKDGFGCNLKGGGAGVVPKAGEHCFTCPDSASMEKCAQNPLESGCVESAPETCGK
jgi:hypothetical protein